MKYFFATLFSLLLLSQLEAQVSVDPNAPYLKDKKLPAFSITSIDGKEITNKQMPKYPFTCIIIFSPDCPHCEKEAGDINKYADKFKNVLFIWDSYRDMESIKKFAVKYNLVGKPNVIIGRDPNFTLPTFYRPRMTPFMALYQKGVLIKVYEEGANVFELIKIIEGK
jgi:thiol-disulfide isomerase/thioredoxin